MKFNEVKQAAATGVSPVPPPPAHSSINLVDLTPDYQEPLVVLVYGDPGGGKSRLLGTAPGDIGVLPMERKSRQSIMRTAVEMGKRVIAPDIDLIRTARAMLIATMPDACVSLDTRMTPEDAAKKQEQAMQQKAAKIPLDGVAPACCQRCYYRWHANRSKHVAFRMSEMDNIRTIGIDTFGQLIDDFYFANYGRNEKIAPLDKKSFNREVSEFINQISHKNIVLTHHSTTVWKDKKPTNKTKPMSAFSRIGHYTSVMCHMIRDEDKVEGEGRYTLVVDDCQANAELIGLPVLYDGDITFANLAKLVYPESDVENWE